LVILFEAGRLQEENEMSRSTSRISKLTLGVMLAGSLAACGQEARTSNQAAMQENVAEANGMAAMNDPSNPYAQSEMQMHETMMAAKGANVSDTWALKMIAHHRGAITMSEVLLEQDPNSRFADEARTVIRDQTAEIRELEMMLQPATPSAAPEPAPVAAPSAVERPPAPRARPQPAPAPKAATPPPAADPHAGHDMANMSNSM
jgi:hypothetical protein